MAKGDFKNLNLLNKTVLLRADFNVPMNAGRISDDYRLRATLPDIKYLLGRQCRLIIATHLGKGDKKNSTKPIASRLQKLLGKKIKVKFVSDCIGPKVMATVASLKTKEILLLENLRWHKEEENNNKNFAKNLAALADIYINDAFAVSHRAHASVASIKKYIPSYLGSLVKDEIANLDKVMKPRRPLVAVFGGAKISDKLSLLVNIAKRADYILVGGALANNFFQYLDYEIGRSLFEKGDKNLEKKVLSLYKKIGPKKIILPVDAVVETKIKGRRICQVKLINEIGKTDSILDIGPRTTHLFARFIKKSATMIWNGPLGKFEDKSFRHGTIALGRVVAARAGGKTFAVIGGGETIEAINQTKMIKHIDWVSTGGGAMLAYLAGENMPGLK